MEKRLCYIDEHIAYFTDDFDNQWGDDWDDKPYEHNAGLPYRSGTNIEMLAYRGDFDTPSDLGGINSLYSVKDINAGKTPWLTSLFTDFQGNSMEIYAGTTMEDFIRKIELMDGIVFIRHRS